jgi:hypothetical protein
MSMLIEDVKLQKRWVLWKLETRDGKETKVPYQTSGRKADSTDPATWQTYAEVAEFAHKFSGMGVVLGALDGVSVWGVDLDKCCDAFTGKFTADSKTIVIGLDSYAEYSPSGEGCHILGIGSLRGRKGKKFTPFPGCKALEIYDSARYLTFTGRHLTKTPAAFMDRDAEVNGLYDRAVAEKPAKSALTVSIGVPEAERLAKLMSGDMSDYGDDHSKADFVLCCLLAKKHDCNAFKIDDEFRESGLYREKWERDDYRQNTITRAIKSVAKDAAETESRLRPEPDDSDLSDDIRELEYVMNTWFPKGEVSLIGAPSGAGKTSFSLNFLEGVRAGVVWDEPVSPRDYRVLSHDRSKRSIVSTVKSLGLPVTDVLSRTIRLTTAQQLAKPHEVLGACLEAHPGAEVWLIEGLDLWIPDMNKMDKVAPIMDGLQRLATLHNVAVIATVGSPKQKGKDRYTGRDSLFGSGALARKSETIVTLDWTDAEDVNSIRRVVIMSRTGQAEVLYFTWMDGKFRKTREPGVIVNVGTDNNRKITKMVIEQFGCDNPVKYLPKFGPERSFYAWQKWAAGCDLILKTKNRWILQALAVSEFLETQTLQDDARETAG